VTSARKLLREQRVNTCNNLSFASVLLIEPNENRERWCCMDTRSNVPTQPFDEYQTLDEILQVRIADLSEWLADNAIECVDKQRHLGEGTPERAYWHLGYLMALCDIQNAIRRRRAFG
jgi:hypothetical protein